VTWPACTPRARRRSAPRGPGSSPACRWTTPPGPRPTAGRAGTPSAASCPTCAAPPTTARWAPATLPWSSRSWRGSVRWPGRTSRPAASTATAGPAMSCGPGAAAGSSTRPRTAVTGRATWPCWPCSARRTTSTSCVVTRPPSRWRPAGPPGCRCTSCTRCWCTSACSAPGTASRLWPRLAPRWPGYLRNETGAGAAESAGSAGSPRSSSSSSPADVASAASGSVMRNVAP
jgi:hypothetical protein